MELAQLNYFLSTANCGQINRAAEMQHVSPSTISLAISRLEKELGIELFRKVGRNIQLTYAGKRFQELITPALAELDFAYNEMLGYTKNQDHTVFLTVQIPDFCSEFERIFYRLYPDTQISQSLDSLELSQMKTRSNLVDFCISYEPFQEPSVISEQIFCDRALLQVSDAHPLARKTSIYLIEAASETFVSFNRQFAMRRWMEGMCFQAGFQPIVRYEVCDTQALLAWLQLKGAVTFISEMTWQYINAQGQAYNPSTTAIRLKDSFAVRKCYISWNRNRVLSASAREFLEALRKFNHLYQETGSLTEAESRLCAR